MITFNAEIVNRLASGSIKNVRLFGENMKRPAAPYAVVKPVAGGDRKLLQIFAHAAAQPGAQDFLEAYIFQELPALLKEPIERDGKRITVYNTGAWIGPYTDESDNTLSMSRDFYIPVINF